MKSGKGDGQETCADSDIGGGMQTTGEFMYFIIFLGFAIMLHASLEFIKAKRTEMAISATSPSQVAEAETVNATVV